MSAEVYKVINAILHYSYPTIWPLDDRITASIKSRCHRYREPDGASSWNVIRSSSHDIAFEFLLLHFPVSARKIAREHSIRFQLDGVGFVFSPEDPYCGVDLDDCRDPETGAIEPSAGEIIRSLESFTEVSPSGRGVKIWLKDKLPTGAYGSSGIASDGCPDR